MDPTKFYSQFIKPDDLCFDIGAYLGEKSKVFLKLGAKVILVEPQECITKIHDQENLTRIQKALGEITGTRKMMISNVETLSTFSKEWIAGVRRSERFPPKHYEWKDEKEVEMTTLDELIKKYGMPSFIKIDVEGYESEVIGGLSKPVNTISIEFTPERINQTFHCINYLSILGEIELNYSFGEPLGLVLKDWVTPKELIKIFLDYKKNFSWPKGGERNMTEGGDVYIRFKNGSE